MGSWLSSFYEVDDSTSQSENTGSADLVKYMMEEQEKEAERDAEQERKLAFGKSKSNYLHTCGCIVEVVDGQFYRVKMTIWTWTIIANKHHKALFVQPAPPGMKEYFAEIGGGVMRDGKIVYPHLKCIKHKSANQPTNRVFEVYLSQSLMHNFCTRYHHQLGHYDPFHRNCQAFVWYILYSHDVDISQLTGICEFGNGLPPVDVQQLAFSNRAEHRRAKPAGLVI